MLVRTRMRMLPEMIDRRLSKMDDWNTRIANQKDHEIYFGVVHAGGELCDEICLSWKQGMDMAMNFVFFWEILR